MTRIVAALLVVVTLTAPVYARRERRDPALVQARSCVGETGWTDVDSCVAMTFVHLRRARLRGTRLDTMARLYSAALRRPRRTWILRLRRDGRRPRGWPSSASWERRRPQWLALLAAVEAALAGELDDPCPGALHYGSTRLDSGRLDPSRWRVLECLPDSGQTFYARAGR